MARYRNARIDNEMQEEELQEQQNLIETEPVVSEEEKNWQKRYADLRRHQQERDAQYREEIEQMKSTIDGLKSQKTSLTPPKSREELEAWIKAYPEFAAINQAMIEDTVSNILKKEGINDLKRTQKEVEAEKAKMRLKKLHPDCEEIFESTGFKEWIVQQPQKHQDFIYKSLNVDDAALVLDRYQLYLEKRKSGDKTRPDNDSAKAVRTRSSETQPDTGAGDYWYSESQIQKGDARWWDAHEKRIEEAQRKGKILMDISGGAR